MVICMQHLHEYLSLILFVDCFPFFFPFETEDETPKRKKCLYNGSDTLYYTQFKKQNKND